MSPTLLRELRVFRRSMCIVVGVPNQTVQEVRAGGRFGRRHDHGWYRCLLTLYRDIKHYDRESGTGTTCGVGWPD